MASADYNYYLKWIYCRASEIAAKLSQTKLWKSLIDASNLEDSFSLKSAHCINLVSSKIHWGWNWQFLPALAFCVVICIRRSAKELWVNRGRNVWVWMHLWPCISFDDWSRDWLLHLKTARWVWGVPKNSVWMWIIYY